MPDETFTYDDADLAPRPPDGGMTGRDAFLGTLAVIVVLAALAIAPAVVIASWRALL